MNAADIMTQDVASIAPDASVADAAKVMIAEQIGGLPVIDASRALVGILTEADLLHRVELGTDKPRSHWLAFLAGAEIAAANYVRTHSLRVADVMTPRVVTVDEDTPVTAIVDIMERHRVKRLPVLRAGRVIGIVTRSNIVRALIAGTAVRPSKNDAEIRNTLENELNAQSWAGRDRQILVHDGVVHLWGTISSPEAHRAAKVAAERIPGVVAFHDHLNVVTPPVGMAI